VKDEIGWAREIRHGRYEGRDRLMRHEGQERLDRRDARDEPWEKQCFDKDGPESIRESAAVTSLMQFLLRWKKISERVVKCTADLKSIAPSLDRSPLFWQAWQDALAARGSKVYSFFRPEEYVTKKCSNFSSIYQTPLAFSMDSGIFDFFYIFFYVYVLCNNSE